MKTAQYWIDKLENVSTERDQQNWVEAIQRDAQKDLREEMVGLRRALRYQKNRADAHAATLILTTISG